MVTRLQLERLSSRIDALEERFAPKGRNESWIVNGDSRWPAGTIEFRDDNATPVAEMRAQPCSGHRIEIILVHPEPGGGGWLAPMLPARRRVLRAARRERRQQTAGMDAAARCTRTLSNNLTMHVRYCTNEAPSAMKRKTTE